MAVLVNLRWKLYDFYYNQLLLWGAKKGYIRPYGEELIEKLRNVYYGGVPASVLLLCRSMTDGYCYDRALLLARTFLNDSGDVKLVYAGIADIRFNPDYNDSGDDHCFVERTTEGGRKFVYDTSTGLIYTKWIYSLINFPRVRHVRSKDDIIKFLEGETTSVPTDRDITLALVIPNIEAAYGRKGEMYSLPGIELLQREVEFFKNDVARNATPRT